MSTVHLNQRSGSDSDASDPTFVPIPSSTPQKRSANPTRSQISKPSHSQQTSRSDFRSSPAKQSSASRPLQHRQQQRPPQRQKAKSPRPEASSSQQILQPHHPGPFTSSPPPPLPRPYLQATFSSSSSPSPSTSRSPPKSHQPPPPLSTRKLRPNSYTGPTSTWRSWTQNERLVAQSLERARAQDLSVHLYCAHVLRRKAERAKGAGESGRDRSQSQSQSRSRSRSQSRPARGRDPKGKSKGKSRAIDDDVDANANGSPARISAAAAAAAAVAVRVETDDETIEEQQQQQQEKTPTFMPPRLWTAWPLPPTEVPREEFLPHALLDGYRRTKDTRPSAELEECLIAATSRAAREMWEAREWESSETDGSDQTKAVKRRKKVESGRVGGTLLRESEGGEVGSSVDVDAEADVDVDVQMSDDRGRAEAQDDSVEEEDNTQTRLETNTDLSSSSASSPSPSLSSLSRASNKNDKNTSTNNNNDDDEDDDIPMFSSQLFTAPSPTTSDNKPTILSSPPPPSHAKPVFLADDDRLRQLLLPSTRHTISQLDNLLEALHKVQRHRRPRKTMDFGARGWEEVIGLSGLFFGKEVVGRARKRCESLFDGDLET